MMESSVRMQQSTSWFFVVSYATKVWLDESKNHATMGGRTASATAADGGGCFRKHSSSGRRSGQVEPYTINWFWPRVAVRVPIITINSSFRPDETIWGHDNDTKRNNQLLSISVSSISTVIQQTKQSTPCFVRTRQPCAATTTPNATTNSSFRPSETIPYNNDNKQR